MRQQSESYTAVTRVVVKLMFQPSQDLCTAQDFEDFDRILFCHTDGTPSMTFVPSWIILTHSLDYVETFLKILQSSTYSLVFLSIFLRKNTDCFYRISGRLVSHETTLIRCYVHDSSQSLIDSPSAQRSWEWANDSLGILVKKLAVSLFLSILGSLYLLPKLEAVGDVFIWFIKPMNHKTLAGHFIFRTHLGNHLHRKLYPLPSQYSQ